MKSGSGLSFSQDNAMQQVLNEKQQLRDEVRMKLETITELEQAKKLLNDSVTRQESTNSRMKDQIDSLIQSKTVLEETVSRNQK